VEGTTGYEFLNDTLRLLAPAQGEFPLDRLYRRVVRDRPPYRIEAYRSKRAVMERHLVGELDRLAYDLDRISEGDYHTRDYAYDALREAIVEVIAALDRYRTYLPYSQNDAEEVLRQAVYRARQRTLGEDPSVFDFLLRVLLGDVRPDLRDRAAAVAGRLQQYSSVVMAKGIEDTAFYRYLRLAPLNEVGGEPDRFSLDADAFHARARFRGLRYPQTLLATATHDHKRGEDLRMRMIVLASVPGAWERTVRTLRTLIDQHSGDPAPAAGDIYLLCQTLAALWEERVPADLEDRLVAYVQKAAREAGLHTSWATPRSDYEDTLERLVRGMMRDNRLPRRIRALAETLRRYGFVNSITQLILKTTTPGVPDFYQGTELLDLSLVDPDNRRPVDFARRQRFAEELEPLVERPDPDLLAGWLAARDERLKLYVMMRLLRFRRAVPEVFTGDYRSLGPDAVPAAVVGFLREHPRGTLLVLLPRFPAMEATEQAAGQVTLPEALAGTPGTDLLTGLPEVMGTTVDPSARPLPWRVVWLPRA
jgi:(1->4)-alpha-D-glucan 1-alpha-D-glucosylmutase